MLLTLLRNAVRANNQDILKQLLLNKGVKKTRDMNSKQTTQQQQAKAKDKADKPVVLRKERQQQAAKKKAVPYIPGTVTLQILGAGSNGSPASVYLFTDQSRYLFNCGEGTQRLAHEHKTKLARLEQIFVTRNTWPSIGGLPGLALTVQDAGVKELSLHGPPYLDNILMSMRKFVVLKNLQLKTVDCTVTQEFEDSVMTVKSLPLYHSKQNGQSAESAETYPNQDSVVISYICTLKPRPGPLNLDKCVEHGVPPGPLLGLLKNGIDVTLENGTLVKSADVSEPNENPLSFIFLDIPSVDFLENLEKHKALLINKRINTDNTPELAVMVHFAPIEVLNNNVYKTFLEKFAPATQHIFLNAAQNTFSGYIAAHRIQYQLNQLNPKVFPILAEATQLLGGLNNKLKKTKLEDVGGNETLSRYSESSGFEQKLQDLNTMSIYHLRPRKGLDRTSEAKLQPTEYINETQIPDFPSMLEKFKADVKNLESSPKSFPKYPIITFLGTGSCIPNKTRNVSAILVQSQDNSYVLLDCGEGTLGQIQRMFGVAKAQEIVKNLKIIYISHLHADHHIGLIGLLTERLKLETNAEEKFQKVMVMAPKQIEPWLNFYQECIHNIKESYELVGNADMLNEPLDLSKTHADLGIESIATCMVKHCPHSFGVKLNIRPIEDRREEPLSLVYSGDSMPCQDLIDLGQNCTILIHEATMEDDLEDEAKLKMHSTISQAIQQGKAMNAQHIILTHFSQRYAKLPRLPMNNQIKNEEEMEAEPLPSPSPMSNVSIAFDNMQISLEELQNFHVMYPVMRSLFADHAEELEQKALKREMKLERKRKLMSS
ncbi:ribonuclease Z, mitochondrial [Stomoxys calcitrans]|uniref:ribonuclease Z, mitochondrial n=1 Tax=Stomoxys calcitrans TaxID=35570 RepID=UPI0027E3ADB2|nr:ribonuclease Z, mitochondrial [Stomoxys calcitrans]